MSKHKFNLRARAKASPVYPRWVLIGQFTTEDDKARLISRMGKFYDEFQSDPVVNDRQS